MILQGHRCPIGNAKRSLTGDVAGLVHAERKLYKAPGSNTMQSLLRAWPSFRVKAKYCCIYSEICKWYQVQTCIFSNPIPQEMPFRYFQLFDYILTFILINLEWILSNFQYSIVFIVQFPRRFKFLRKRANFLFSSPFLQRNTLTCKLDFLLCTSIQKGSHASSYLT